MNHWDVPGWCDAIALRYLSAGSPGASHWKASAVSASVRRCQSGNAWAHEKFLDSLIFSFRLSSHSRWTLAFSSEICERMSWSHRLSNV